MFIAIVIIAIVTGILFFVPAVSLAAFIYHSVKKNGEAKRKCLQVPESV